MEKERNSHKVDKKEIILQEVALFAAAAMPATPLLSIKKSSRTSKVREIFTQFRCQDCAIIAVCVVVVLYMFASN
jgi:hypothetical protein